MKKLFVIFAAIAMVGAFAATTMAADWAFYGSIRFATWYDMSDNGDVIPANGQEDDAGLNWSMQGNSRIGGKVSGGDVSGHFEMGTYKEDFDSDGVSDSQNMDVRILWGTYDFGGWTFSAGQNYTLVNNWTSVQVWGDDNGLLFNGALYGSRKQQVQLDFGMFKLALIETASSQVIYDDTDVILPKIEASFGIPVGEGSIGIKGGVNMFTNETFDGDDSEDIMAYVLSADGFHGFGPIYFNWSAFWAQNYGNYGLYSGGNFTTGINGAVATAAGDIEDSTAFGGTVVVGGAISEVLRWEAGVGYIQFENDAVGSDAESMISPYGQMKYNFAKSFYVVPEVGAFMYGDDQNGDSYGQDYYVGAQWRMDF